MTLRGVIQGLFGGSDGVGANDIEAVLADNGFGDLPADMFSQALASYADTAPMAEADALTPVLASLDSGDPSDVFAVLDERPLAVDAGGSGAESAVLGASLIGLESLDDAPEFGESADLDDLDPLDNSVIDDSAVDDSAIDDSAVDDSVATSAGDPTDLGDGDPINDPFADDDEVGTESFEELFETEPEATGDDPSDLDLDF